MAGLDMRQLEYFVEAAVTENFSQAAKSLFVSPQAISKNIQLLEDHFGMLLFERSSGGLKLTPFGVALLERARTLLHDLDSLDQLADLYRSGHNQSITLGINSFCFKEHGGTLDNKALLVLQRKYPSVNWEFIEMQGDLVSEEFSKGNIDFGITIDPCSDCLKKVCLSEYPLAALASQNSFLFKGKEQITLHELSHGRMITFSGEKAFNDTVFKIASAQGLHIQVSPLQIRSGTDTDTLSDDYYAIRPLQHARRTVKDKKLRLLPIIDEKGSAVAVSLYLFWSKKKLTPTEDALVDYIMGIYRNKGGSRDKSALPTE